MRGAFVVKRQKLKIIFFSANIILVSLTLGLMGLDELHLRVLATSSEDLTQKRNAQKGLNEIISSIIIIFIYIHCFFETVLKLMQKGRHWVLVVRFWCLSHRSYMSKFSFKGSSTGQCRKYVCFGYLKPEFIIIL